MLAAQFFFLIPDCCWECACVLQKALMNICCIPVFYYITSWILYIFFFIFPSETDVRLVSVQLHE